jgi:predicted AAA+ superfamily ATPase
MFKRAEYKLIKSRLEEPRKYIQVLMGPRQVGKTTLVKQVLDAIKIPWQFYSADNVSTTSNSWISNIWEATRILKDSSGAQTYILVIDEIQKISNWSEAVKKEWDADTWNKTDIRVLLLGSSRVMLMRGLSESLAGRFEEIRMEHWSYKEMKECFGFSLEQYIFFGGYPGAAPLINEYDRFRDYIISSIIETTINKDILIDTPIGKPALLRQTFELGAAYSGKILSLTKMLGSLQDAGNTVTLSGYLNLLSESGLLTALQKFSVDLARRRASIPKFQVWDNSILNVYNSVSLKEALLDRKEWGHILESGIGAYLINQSFVHRFEVYYWREKNSEVDFVLKKGKSVVAIEVKSNAEKNTEGLSRFKNMYNPTHAILIGNAGISTEEFLNMDIDKLF